jgi:hypothetical protein
MKEKEGHDGHTIFLRFYLSDRDDLARKGLVLRTRANYGLRLGRILHREP